MKRPFQRITVIGLGLLGGSVGLAARSRGVADEVIGVSRRPETAEEALRVGAADRAGTDLGEGVRDAELVVLSTPVPVMEEILRKAAPHLREGALVTDVGSVKGVLAERLPAVLPEGVTYVGAHPMAGSHMSGLSHARPDLFDGAPCIVSALAETPRDAVARVEDFWSALGARVLERDPAEHDEQVGWISHVPHAIAFAFARAIRHAPAGSVPLRGSGFRDFTRIARSDPELWAEIFAANRKAVAGPLREVADQIAELARMIEAGDAEALDRFIVAARENLACGENDARSGGENPEIQAVPERTATKE